MAENKAKLHTTYYYIALSPDWTSYTYEKRENVMDQDDRYCFATGNWSYNLEELKARTFDVLHILTCKTDEEIAQMMILSE